MNKYQSWRWVILCLGIAANLVQGIIYSGSVISKPVLLMVGVAEAEVKSHWSLVFSLGLVFLPLGMVIAGWLADKKGPRLPIGLGAVIYVLGLILASFASSYAVLCFTLGFMVSLGNGLAYGPIVASAVRWFPDRRGLASGLVVGALGFGPVWIAPFSSAMLTTYDFEIATVLRCIGIIALVAMGAAAFLITSPPADFQVAAKPQKSVTPSVSRDIAWRGMLVTADFWVLFFLFVLGTMPGLMLLSQASSIFQNLGQFSLGQAALLVAVLGAANATGRVLWGAISDYLGRINTLAVMFVCSAIAMFTLPFATNPALLVAVILVIGTTFGGSLGLFPSFCSELFGLKNVSLNYAILFCAFALSALVGPQVYGFMPRPEYAFFTAAAFALLGAVTTTAYKIKNKK